MNTCSRVVLWLAAFAGAMSSRGETALFLMSGPIELRTRPVHESYVVAVSDSTLIQQARAYLRAGAGSPYLIPRVQVAGGADDTNRNYAEPERPPWSWHVTSLTEWTSYDPSIPRTLITVRGVDNAPAEVGDIIAGDATNPPLTSIRLIHYPLVMELAPGSAVDLVNLSTRGWVDVGGRVLIAGFVVQGGTPCNVVVRGVGPSLAAFGVTETLSDPKITVFHDGEAIALNDDWEQGNFVRSAGATSQPWYAWLFPTNPREAAIRLSLQPGRYTVHLAGVGETTGIGLVEVYDLDGLRPR